MLIDAQAIFETLFQGALVKSLFIDDSGVVAKIQGADGVTRTLTMKAGAPEPPKQPEPLTPPPAPEPQKPSSAQVRAAERTQAQARLRVAISDAMARGGAPMRILGFNPHNRLEDPNAGAAELESTAELLEKWSPENPSVVEKNVAARKVPPPTGAPHPAETEGRAAAPP